MACLLERQTPVKARLERARIRRNFPPIIVAECTARSDLPPSPASIEEVLAQLHHSSSSVDHLLLDGVHCFVMSFETPDPTSGPGSQTRTQLEDDIDRFRQADGSFPRDCEPVRVPGDSYMATLFTRTFGTANVKLSFPSGVALVSKKDVADLRRLRQQERLIESRNAAIAPIDQLQQQLWQAELEDAKSLAARLQKQIVGLEVQLTASQQQIAASRQAMVASRQILEDFKATSIALVEAKEAHASEMEDLNDTLQEERDKQTSLREQMRMLRAKIEEDARTRVVVLSPKPASAAHDVATPSSSSSGK